MREMKRHNMLEKALHILELIAQYPSGISFTKICTDLSLPKSSVHSLLSTFEDMGYLKKEGDGQYQIGIRAFEIGAAFSENNGFYSHVKGILKELVDEVGETAHLATLDGTDVVYINKYDCSHAVRMISHIGKRVPAYATGIGKAILAYKSTAEIQSLYPEESLQILTANTIRSRALLLRELAEIRKTGFATEVEESTPGIRCIAVPIRNDRIQADIAISIAVPLSRAEDGMTRFETPILKAKAKLESM